MEKLEKIWTKRFISLFCTNMAVFFVFYGLVSVLPLYATEDLNRSDSDAGLLLSIFLLSAIITRPFTGKVLEHFGKRKLLYISLIGYFVCTVLYLFFKPFALLLLLRFIQGIFFSILTTANNSIAADIVPPSRKGAGLGYFTMSLNLAVVLGPFVGLLVIQYLNFEILFIIMSAVILIGGIAALSIKLDDIPQGTKQQKFSIAFSDLFEKKALPTAALACFVAIAYASVLSFLSVYAKQKGLMEVASLFYAVYAAAMLLTRPLTGRLYDQKGPKFVIIPGFILFILGLITLAYVNGPVLFMLAGVLIGLGYGALVPSFQSMTIQSTDPRRTGYATATFFTLFDVGIALGSWLLGIIATHYGYVEVYLAAAFVVAIGAIAFMLTQLKKQLTEVK
ncbi:MFS transporter [Viridibacillus sp. FSL R5-0477]|uniref:Antibiotic resistance protein n=1 Tax=Viridibacillus arenosi FSL R5-213 TaxID=1227360 RepID=W4EKJ2_9BACL|nr:MULTISPECIES: MFS transporter [Viridibacillus]ETT81080.1 antibiotic resistance protein [Viridibacillus arenosi FSL R5-213]OMC88557.1 MFS transporter [Viridibacillus sp. FSL H7-0596]OMC93190.1 MFS transporter [Viridibacillus arenosi]